MTRRKRYDSVSTASNYVSARPPQPVPTPSVEGPQPVTVFVVVSAVLGAILGVLAVGIVGLIGRAQEWTPQLTALWCLVGWGGACLVALPWLLRRVLPLVDDVFEQEDD